MILMVSGGIGRDGLKRRFVFMNGGSSIQRAARSTVIGRLALILKRYGNGGTMFQAFRVTGMTNDEKVCVANCVAL